MDSLQYLKDHHPHRVVDNDFKFKIVIGLNEVESDRILIDHLGDFKDYNDFELLDYIHNGIYKDNQKYIIKTNSVYFLKYCYKGEIFLYHDDELYMFEEYESYDNYLDIFEGEITKINIGEER